MGWRDAEGDTRLTRRHGAQGLVSNILEENVLQPLLVSTSAIELATETVALILRIDDIQVGSESGSRGGALYIDAPAHHPQFTR